MPFTTEEIVAPVGNQQPSPKEFDLPVKEFIGYDQSQSKKPVAQNTQSSANAQQTNTTEKADVSTETAPTKEESVQLSPKIAAIARKEQAIRKEAAQLKADREKMAAKLADAEKYAQIKAKLAAKDFSAVEELGVKYDDHLKYETEKLDKQDPKEERVRKLEAELEALRKNQEEREVENYEANQSLWKQEIARIVDDTPELSAIKKLGAYGAVLAHVNDSFEEDGVKLTAEQAAKEVNDLLIARAKKFASVLETESSAEGKVLGPPPKSTGIKTITQDVSVTSKAPSKKPFHLMSESEQLAEAIRRVDEEKLKRIQSMR